MAEALTVRPTTQADLPVVERILSRSYPILLKNDYPPSVIVTVAPLISHAQPKLVTCGTYYLVETVQGDARGCGGWTPHGPRGEPEAHVRHVATDPDHVRKGAARALLAHIFDSARALGVIDLHCLSTLTAEPFYAAMGFERRDKVVITLRPGIEFQSVDMVRSL